MRATAARASGVAALAVHAAMLVATWTRIEDTTRTLHAAQDATRTLANATVCLEAFGHAVVAWTWLEVPGATRALESATPDETFHRGRRAACRCLLV